LIALAACTASETPSTNPVVEPVSSPATVQPKLKVVPPFGMYCDVSRIRANFWGRGTLETAYVWRELTPAGGCPKQGGRTFVGFGLDDGSVDQELGPYGCLTTCTAMAAKDLNRDGLAELIVSDGMADGWAMRLFGVSYRRARRDRGSAASPSRQDMAPILVRGSGDPLVDPGVLWIGASGSAGASRGARCTTLPTGGPGLVIRAMTGAPGNRRTAIVELDGVRATVIRAWNDTVVPRHHPSSGLHCALAAVPAPPEAPLCGAGNVTGDFDGDGAADRLSVGTVFGSDRGCGYGHRKRLDIDLASDGVRDVSMYPYGCRDWCGLYGTADLNADGQLEIFLMEPLSPPNGARIGIYELVGSDLQPVRFPGGSNRFSVQYSSYGDAGAYCTDATTLLLWHAKNVYSDAGMALSMNEATFRFDPMTLSMTQLTGWTRSRPTELPRDPRRPLRICGSPMADI